MVFVFVISTQYFKDNSLLNLLTIHDQNHIYFTCPRFSSSLITVLSTLNNIAYKNAYLLKSSEFFTLLEVVTFKVPSYCERVEEDEARELKSTGL